MSAIDIALIAPGPWTERYCSGRPFQMMLPDVVRYPDRSDYRAFYRANNSFTILDNGAWESVTLGPEALMDYATVFGVTEVVAPDIIDDPVSTYEAVGSFLDIRHRHEGKYPQVAVVAHGGSMREAKEFIVKIVELDCRHISTIMVGRAFTRAVKNPTARFELALWTRQQFGKRFQFHLLGFNDDWPMELQFCRAWPGLVRSMDTVAPFTYAMLSQPIENVGRVRVARPGNYFSRQNIPGRLEGLIQANIGTLDKWGDTRAW